MPKQTRNKKKVEKEKIWELALRQTKMEAIHSCMPNLQGFQH